MLVSVGHGTLDRAGLTSLLVAADVEAMVDIRGHRPIHRDDVQRIGVVAVPSPPGRRCGRVAL